MTPEQFAYWMQGFVEIQNSNEPPTKEQWQIIKDHLQLVFNKVTPQYTPQNYCSHQIDYKSLYYPVDEINKGEVDFNKVLISC
jgi:hypothetical protein